jgi:hypothetical protein
MPQIFGKTNRAVPTLASDNSQTQVRLSQYGDVTTTQLMDNHSTLADEGSYFKVTNATPGTAVAAAISSSFLSTAALFAMVTGATSGKRCYLDYIRLVCNVAGAGSTNLNFLITIDNAARSVSGGTAATPVNVNMDSARTSSLTSFTFGTVTLGAASAGTNNRIVHRSIAKTQAAPCLVVGDVYAIDFGEHAQSAGLLSGTAATMFSISSGPVVFGANSTLALHWWGANNATTAPSFEYEVAWWER